MKNCFLILLVLFSLTDSNGQTITSITPNQGTAGSTISAIVTCQNTFFQISSPQGVRNVDLKFGGCEFINGTNISVIDDNHVSVDFVIPANAPNGTVDLEVANWNPPIMTLPGSFTISGGLNVSVNSISPNSVSENQVVTFTISGSNLSSFYLNNPYQGFLRKGYKTLNTQSWTLINANTIEAQFYIPAYCDSGYYDLTIGTYSKGCYKLTNAVHVSTSNPKELVSITPNSTSAGNTLSAVVTSVNTFFMTGSPQGLNKVELRDNHCNKYVASNINVSSDVSFSADFNIPADARNGFYDLFVETEMGPTFLLPSSLEVINGLDIDLISFSPNTAIAGTTLNAIVSGSNVDHIFNSPILAELRSNSGFVIQALNINSTSSLATMDFQIPIYAQNAGYNLNVASSAGCYNLPQPLQITGGQPREIISITPNSGYRGQTLSALMTGSNTYFMSGTLQGGIRKVEFVGQMPGNNQFTVNNPDITVLDTNRALLDFTIPLNMHAGWYTVTSENYAGDRWSLQPGFEILGTVLSGTVTFDIDSSGTFTSGDSPMPGRKILLLPDSVISITDANGNYFFSVDSGQYTISMYPDTNWFVTTSPQQITIAVDTTDIPLLDFGLQPLVDEYNVYTTITPGIPRCGTNMAYTITYTNNSTTSIDGQVYAVIDTGLTYISSVPPYDVLSNDTMYWNYTGLAVNNSATILLTVSIPSVAGDTITTAVGVNAISGGSEVAAFTNSNSAVIRCSFDPNDKSVEPAGVGSANFVLINGYLEYLVRFQNTGNDTAFTVMILDTISESLDMSTFNVVAVSHAVETHIYGNVAEFRFNNILLADSFVNEPASHGFVKYRIKPFSNSTVGTRVENVAGIYFDLNQPVITNTTINTLTDQLPVGIQVIEFGKQTLVIYPNPSSQYFNLLLPESFGKSASVKIVNLQNQIVKSISTSERILTIDLSEISAGIYFVSAISSDGKQSGNARIVRMK
jgi:uncharacterized repeat protein (TIGR01451 family)